MTMKEVGRACGFGLKRALKIRDDLIARGWLVGGGGNPLGAPDPTPGPGATTA